MLRPYILFVIISAGLLFNGSNSLCYSSDNLPQTDSTFAVGEIVTDALLNSKDSLNILKEYNHKVNSAITAVELIKADQHCKTIENIVFSLNKSADKARYFHLRGMIYHEFGDFNLAEYYFGQSIDIYNELGLADSIVEVQFYIIENYRYLNNYEKGLVVAYQLLNYYEKQNDSSQIVKVRDYIGRLHIDNNDIEIGLKYMIENLDYHKRNQDSVKIGQSLNNVGLVFNMFQKMDTAILYLKESLRIRKQFDDSLGIFENYSNLSNCYYKLGEWEKSLIYANRSLEYLRRSNQLKYLHFVLRNIGNIKLEQGLLDEAEEYYSEFYKMYKENNSKEAAMLYYGDLYKIENLKLNYAKALDYYKISQQYQDSINKEKKSKIVSELEIRYQTERKEKLLQAGKHRIDTLEKERLITRTRNAFVIVSIVLLSLVIVIIINRRRIRQKRDLIILRKEEELTRIKLDHANESIEASNLKLRDFTDNLIEKTRLIENLEEKLSQFHDLNDEQKSIRLHKQEELLKLKILTEEDWIRFKTLFNEVHHGFLTTLTNQNPNLTEGEKRYLILLKLNVNPKEMASILGISPSGVYACKSRLKKKLGYGDNEEINDVVATL